MKFSDIVLNDKHYDILNDETQIIFAEGVTNSGKSLILGFKFFQHILRSSKEENQFMIAGQSVPVIEKMYIQNESSFYNMFPPLCEYSRGGQGGAKITVQANTGPKFIYLVGYDNAKRWKDILGLKINGSLVEEINIANDEFISELFMRTFRNSGFLLASSNGADPDTYVYTEYLDKGRPLEKYTDQVPDSTWECLNRAKASSRYRYYFFTFADNGTMKQSEIDALLEETPEGSWMWLTKILGERGIREGAVFADYMTYAKNMIKWSSIFPNNRTSDYPFVKYTIGIDVGAEDYTVFTLNGFTLGYQHQVVIDYVKINHAGTEEIWTAFKNWYDPYDYIVSGYMHGAFIDYAGGGAIVKLSIHDKLKKKYGIQIVNAFKYRIRERCDVGIKLLHQGRLVFTDRSEDIYKAFTKAFYNDKREKEGKDIRDFKSHINKDYVDATEYGTSPFMKHMIAK
jgi:hypothetical protein